MPAKKLLALVAALLLGLYVLPAKADERTYINLLIQYYADYYDVPVDLVHRVVIRESTYNPRARNGPYWGLMQILPETARTMGFTGKPEDLLNPETNLIYAVKYLRGAYIVAGGNHDAAVRHYASGYYYAARDKGLLEETGLRPGPLSPVAPQPPTAVAAAEMPPTPPARIPEFDAPVVAATALPQAADQAPQAPIAVALGFLPPQRPNDLATIEVNPALEAIEAAGSMVATASPPPQENELGASILTASAYMGANPEPGLRPAIDMFEGTFSVLDAMAKAQGGASRP